MHPLPLRRSVLGFLGLLLAFVMPSRAAAAPAPEVVGFTVTPAAPGEQMVRTSLPFPPGLIGTNSLPQVLFISPSSTGVVSAVALRVLSLHPAAPGSRPSVRRGLVSFVHAFGDRTPVRFELRPGSGTAVSPSTEGNTAANGFPVDCELRPDGVRLRWTDGTELGLSLVAPAVAAPAEEPRDRGQPRLEEVESSPMFRWQRLHVPDADWPRVIEVRLDRQGTVAVSAHLQRAGTNGVFAPELGWDVRTRGGTALEFAAAGSAARPPAKAHGFSAGTEAVVRVGGSLELRAPTGAASRRGGLELGLDAEGGAVCRYRRCLASESVPHPWMAWRRADLTFVRPGVAAPTITRSSPHAVEVESRFWALLYGMPGAPVGLPAELDSLLRYHRLAVVRSAADGDDLGNVTGFNDGQEQGGAFGMNRLNHGAAIFEDAWRSADRRLLETAVLWCDNFHDLSIWWGQRERGGTRYNNIVAAGRTRPRGSSCGARTVR